MYSHAHGGASLVPVEDLAGVPGCRLDDCWQDATSIALHLQPTSASAACPVCDTSSGRVHSRYRRTLSDLSCFGRAVHLVVAVRRFFCSQARCSRRIFAERLSGLARPYARTTDRLRRSHETIGLALGGEPGSRFTAHLAIRISADTLLRRVKQLEENTPVSPRIVGIDEWAWLKGHRYGTIIVDIERGHVVDLLPDRDATTVKNWFDKHPGVEVVSRDRSSAFARAISESAPNARQVADRWHLMKNLREAIERLFEQEFALISAAIKPAQTAAEPTSRVTEKRLDGSLTSSDQALPPPEPAAIPTSARRQSAGARRQRRIERFEQVHKRFQQGQSVRSIARAWNGALLREALSAVRRLSGLENETRSPIAAGPTSRLD